VVPYKRGVQDELANQRITEMPNLKEEGEAKPIFGGTRLAKCVADERNSTHASESCSSELSVIEKISASERDTRR